MTRTQTDPVTQPAHYEGNGITDAMTAMASMMHEAKQPAMQIYWWGCAFKYLWRWPRKNGKQDLQKAIRCIEYLLTEVSHE